ncbi:DUF5359 family protein [Aquibacillus rhizosphaerae]|uniref:DUF5359 family protein n=1 Tax=Aquibacillus rhizosphaerae TaxID=3051431 RepID=A0ABT7L5V5_9BACI|nr:DUF5359 family protein [Aquibacillus sp. LR5S19]MDL4840784.1 DUF5359 family protein [Aquibacillus sp. LR5S19]
MRRVERWIVTLLLIQTFLLVVTQFLISNSEIQVYVDPVYQYLGVFKDEDSSIKTIDHILKNVLSF